jgi:hypothetical protein
MPTSVWNTNPPQTTITLEMFISHIATSLNHDERLFLTILLTGFHGLLQLGKLPFPDKVDSCDYHKITLCHIIKLASTLTG